MSVSLVLRCRRAPRCQECVRDGRPGFLGLAAQGDSQALNAEIGGEFQVRFAVADHEAVRLIDVMAPQKCPTMPSFGLRQAQFSRLKCGQRNTASNSIPCELNRSKIKRCARSKDLARKVARPQSVLIRDHDKGEAGAFQFQQRRDDAGHQADLRQTVYLLVGHLFVQRAVAVEEQDAASRSCDLHAMQQRIVLRARTHRDPQRTGSAGWARKSRTIRPPARVLVHESIRIPAIDQQKIGVAGPHLVDPGRSGEAAAQIVFFHEQCVQSGL